MPTQSNTTLLQNEETPSASEDNRETMVKVDGVSMIFNMASEQLNSLKEYAIAIARRELRFKEFRALDAVSFEVKRGDVFGILGTNGSGKSTMLKIIAGVLEPTEGACEINGKIAPLIELGAGFDLELTARENIFLNGALLGYSRKFIEKHFQEIVDFAEIEAFLDMPMKNYSSGMVARVAFAVATVIVPDILIVDEVLSVGDFMFQKKCEDRIKNLIEDHNVTVLIVSHNNDQIERLCNKAIWIEKGHTRMIGDVQDVCKVYRILGGHTGSSESEQRVFSMLENPVSVIDGTVYTIAGEDRYGASVKLAGKIGFHAGESVIVAPGESNVSCMIATGLAGALDAPVLHTKANILPDITAQELKALSPHTLILIGQEEEIHDSVEEEIREICGSDLAIARISGHSSSQLATNAYTFIADGESEWGIAAVITHEESVAEFVSASPFAFNMKTPVFFVQPSGNIDDKTKNILSSGSFEKVLVLGDAKRISSTYLGSLMHSGIEIIRLSGETSQQANDVVNEWLLQKDSSGAANLDNMLVCSPQDAFDAIAGGIYAGKTHSAFLLEDPTDLDSVAHALDFIHKCRGKVKRLTFLGGSFWFNALDKEILGKAVSQELMR